MSQVLTTSDAPNTNILPQLSIPASTGIFLVLVSLLHLPFILPQTREMWDSEHYSFFPLAIAAFLFLAWERLREFPIAFSGYFNKRTVLYGTINILLFTLAVVARSNWLGWVSFLFFLVTAAHLVFSSSSVEKIRGTFWVLLLIIPLPLNLDNSLVIQLQKVATEQASLLLDFMGIHHAVSGVTVTLPNKVFQIDDACSGIRSLFSAITTMLIFAVYFKYGPVRVLATLAQAALWVLVVNSFRVFFVVYAFHKWDAGLESGWRHDALGIVCYLLMILLAISTDQAIRYFFPLPGEFAGKRKPKWELTWLKSIQAWFDKPFHRKTSTLISCIFLAGFLFIGGAGVTQAWQQLGQTKPGNFSQELVFALTETDMPATVNGWNRVGFRALNRDKSDPFGTNSVIWTYEHNGALIQFSIDGAYPDFHDLWYCYSSIGWSLRHSENIPFLISAEQDRPATATELQLFRGTNEESYVLFTCLDSEGTSVDPPPAADTAVRRLLNRLRSGNLLSSQENQRVVPPVIQFQSYSYSDVPLLEQERIAIRDLFTSLSQAAKRRIMQANP